MGTSFVNLYWNPPAFFVHRHCLMEYLPNEGRFVTCLMCMSNHIPSKGSGGRFYIPPLIWDWFHKSHLGGDPSLAKRGKARHKKVWFLGSTVVLGWVSALPWDNRSNLTLDIQLEKDVACTTILALGCTLVRVKYCNPTMDLGKVPTNFALDCTEPKLKSLRYLTQTTHPNIVSFVFLYTPTHSYEVGLATCWLRIL